MGLPVSNPRKRDEELARPLPDAVPAVMEGDITRISRFIREERQADANQRGIETQERQFRAGRLNRVQTTDSLLDPRRLCDRCSEPITPGGGKDPNSARYLCAAHFKNDGLIRVVEDEA
jgi:hypothetical protein